MSGKRKFLFFFTPRKFTVNPDPTQLKLWLCGDCDTVFNSPARTYLVVGVVAHRCIPSHISHCEERAAVRSGLYKTLPEIQRMLTEVYHVRGSLPWGRGSTSGKTHEKPLACRAEAVEPHSPRALWAVVVSLVQSHTVAWAF